MSIEQCILVYDILKCLLNVIFIWLINHTKYAKVVSLENEFRRLVFVKNMSIPYRTVAMILLFRFHMRQHKPKLSVFLFLL